MNIICRIWVAGCIVLASAGCALLQTVPQDEDSLESNDLLQDYVLKSGDEIDLQVFRESDLSGLFQLDQSGRIRHPLLGYVHLQGVTLQQAEYEIKQQLASQYLVDPKVFVTLPESSRAQVVLLGEVKQPGVRSMPSGQDMTLLQAIAEAGGFTDLAAINRVKIVRRSGGEDTSIRVRVPRIIEGEEPDIRLLKNDVIMVPQVLF